MAANGRTVRVVAVGSSADDERAWVALRRILLNFLQEHPDFCPVTRTGPGTADDEPGLPGSCQAQSGSDSRGR